MSLKDWNGKVGVSQVNFGHKISLSNSVTNSYNTLHFEVSVFEELIEGFQVDYRAPIVWAFLGDQKIPADIAYFRSCFHYGAFRD
jgi:hypothetical protein